MIVNKEKALPGRQSFQLINELVYLADPPIWYVHRSDENNHLSLL